MRTPERIAAWIWDRAAPLLALLAAITVAAVWAAAGVGVDNSLKVWFVDDDPQLAAYARYQEKFGNDEAIVIAFHDPAGMLGERGLALLRRAESALRSVEGIAGVVSAASVERLASRDGTTAAVLARMEPASSVDARRDAILARVDGALAELRVPHHKAGIGVLYAALNRISIVDALVLFGLAAALMFAVLWALFRRVGAALATVGLAATATAWALGLYGAAGRDLNMVTSVMPTVILVVSVAEAVHLLMEAARPSPHRDRRAKAIAVMGSMMRPCALNVLTSALGFASLAFAPLPAVRDLGIFTAVGLIGSLALTVVGATLVLRWPSCEPRPSTRGRLARFASWLCELGLRRPVATLCAGLIFAALAAGASSRIVVDTFTLGFLDADHPVRRDAEFIEARLGPYIPLDFVVRARDGTVDAELVQAIARWQRAAEALPGVGRSRSVADDLAERTGTLPDDDGSLGLELAALRLSPAARLDPRIDASGSLRITFPIRNQSAASAARTLRAIRDAASLPQGVRLEPAGYIPLYIRMIDFIVASQVSGFALAFATVFGIIALALRSAPLALLAIPSNLLPLLAVLATMGAAGIRLDAATATIASVVLGLVVDDTVHLLHRLRAELGLTADLGQALRRTVDHTGRPILVVAVVLALGFSVFGFSEIRSVVDFGLLIALAMGSGVLADLLVVPALAVVIARRSPHAYRAA